MQPIRFTVYGNAEPAGSKRGLIHPHTGRVMVLDANPRSRGWKDCVAAEAARAYSGPLLDCALEVVLTFYRPRPRSHMRSKGGVRPSAPAYPITRPDSLKLARGAEDAMSGIVYRDDAATVDLHIFKRFGEPSRVEIEVLPKAEQTAGEYERPALIAA